ncbi:uncharacterized protein LOC119382223 [Rhipicephalus sanguineus]|uniref:uncharacterized protein LOC119382223 n=1 Tax=Rhipicephalus sanguineus TaxID=34632 RepID=UPI0020C38F9F|nr:uncharacterized protein LOC119382223 [Rhipicephalus sanguineus]
MPVNCCVPLCTQFGSFDKSGNKVSYHRFPRDEDTYKKWIAAIRRDEGPLFKVCKATKVCSLHFLQTDFVANVANGYRHLHSSAVPSVFPFKQVKPSRKPPAQRAPLHKVTSKRKRNASVQGLPSGREVDCNQADKENAGDASNIDVLNVEDAGTTLPLNHESPEEAPVNTCTCSESISVLDNELAASKAREAAILADNQALKQRIKSLEETVAFLENKLTTSNATRETNEHLKQQIKEQNKELQLIRSELITAQKTIERLEEVPSFGAERFKESDEDIEFYTGLPTYQHFVALMDLLDFGENGENVVRKTRRSDLQNHDSRGRQHKVSIENQLFLVLVKLRVGLFHRHLGHLFNISASTVSRIFSTILDFMYLQLTEITTWISRRAIDAAMPSAFKEKYPSTRVILDATEIRCDVPTSFVTQSQVYSNYKSAHTLKGLVGISPHGVLTFVSELFTGCTSDRECVERSGFLKLKFDPGDSVMADKGFKIKDLLQEKQVMLNIPPFLMHGQFTPEEVEETQEIAAIRIHVERKIKKIKGYHIFDRSIPISLAPLANQMWAVSAFLTNFQPPLLKEDTS